MERNEIYSVFRFLLCFGIVLFHYGPRSLVSAHAWVSSAAINVTFFFVLSGFLMATSASQAKEFDPFDFLGRRLSKLLPLHYFSLALFVALQAADFDWLAFLLNLVLLQSWIPPFPLWLNFPAWFISCLFSHLLLFPMIFRHGQGYRMKPSRFLFQALGFWAGTQVILTILFNSRSFYQGFMPLSHDLIFYSPLSHLCSFVLGIALGILHVQSLPIRITKWASLAFCGATLLVIFGTLQSGWLEGVSSNLPLGASFFGPAFGALVFSVALLPREVRSIFNLRVVRFLGEISFPIYLLQLPVRVIAWWAFPFAADRALDLQAFLLYFALLMGAATLFQVLIQEKAGRLVLAGVRMARGGVERIGHRLRALQGGE